MSAAMIGFLLGVPVGAVAIYVLQLLWALPPVPTGHPRPPHAVKPAPPTAPPRGCPPPPPPGHCRRQG